MPYEPPTLEEWRGLFEDAVRFKNMKPWEYFPEGMVFGVLNPYDNLIYYCVVLGKLGEMYGLVANKGSSLRRG